MNDRNVEILEQMEVQHRGIWHRCKIVRVITATFVTIGFYVPTLAAEGFGFSDERQATATMLKLIVGMVLVLAAVL